MRLLFPSHIPIKLTSKDMVGEATLQPAIELRNLTKFYGSHRGIEDITLEVYPGEIVGFLGPNGAGKTTTIRVLMGLLRPTAGQASIMALDIVCDSVAIRRHVGYLPGEASLYGEMTGQQLLDMVLRVRSLEMTPHVRQIIDILAVPLHQTMKRSSRGMRQKVAILLALAHDPDVLILDEPTSGLDPLMQHALHDLLRQEQAANKAIFLSSHVLSEVEAICSRVAMIKDGHLLTVGPLDALLPHRHKEVIIAYYGSPPALVGLPDLEVLWRQDQRLGLRIRGDLNPLLRRLAECHIRDLTITEPSLEEAFLTLYQGEGERP